MIKAGVKGVKKSRINKILPQKKGRNFRFTALLFIKSLSVAKQSS